MENNVKALYDAIGAFSEMCGMFYKGLLKQNFSEEQSFELTKVFLASQIANITHPKQPPGGAS